MGEEEDMEVTQFCWAGEITTLARRSLPQAGKR